MGAEIKRSNPDIDGESSTERSDRTNNPSTSSTSTTATGTGTGGTGTGGTGTGTGKTEEKELSGLPILADEKEQKRLEKNAKRRERYAKEKAAGGQTVKPRKVNKKKVEENPIDSASLNMIFATVSGIIASRPNCEQWLLSEAEINSITTPLTAMLKDSEYLQNIGQYSNQIALVTACTTILLPRLVITVQKQKEVKKVERNATATTDNGTIRNIAEKKESNSNTNRPVDRKPTDNNKKHGNDLSFYGSAIC